MSTPFPHLFSPFDLGPLRLKNRVVASGTTTNYADERGRVTDRLIAYYVARARGGTGLIVTESTIVERRGLGAARQLAIFGEEELGGLTRLASAIHQAGAPVLLQLAHGGGQARESLGGEPTVGPSEMVNPRWGTPTRALCLEEISDLVQTHVAAARRAREAGFDGVELHAAHGYLLGQFLSPYYNHRVDRYGGTLANRARLVCEIVAAIREAIGGDFLIAGRFSADDAIPGGNSVGEAPEIARLLQQGGVDLLDVSAGMPPSRHRSSPPAGRPEPALADLAAAVKAAVSAPVATVGRIVFPDTAERILTAGQADLVALARALIADPAWAEKASRGAVEEIAPCVGCMVCTGRTRRPEIVCPVNPATGREYLGPAERTARPRRIVVVGSGMPGLEFARVAAERGHDVTVVDPSPRFGGLAGLRATSPLQQEVQRALDYWRAALERVGVPISTGSRLTAALFSRAETVLDARPGSLIPSPPSGVLDPDAALERLRGSSSREPVTVCANGMLGAELAHTLAARGYGVELLEHGPEPAADAHPSARLYLLEALRSLDVRIRVNVDFDQELAAARARVGDAQVRPWLVWATGLGETNEPALAPLLPAGCELITIGDAYRPDDAAELVVRGWEAARAI
ncbi:MAG: FAD-dependent oxidoreductase [Chloroflexi bacterium]|nr:FAD-dependent oxidoreductase [Chloroflexota bacterium]